MTVYGLLQADPRFNGRIYPRFPVKDQSGVFAVVTEADENANVALYGQGSLTTKLVQVTLYEPAQPSSDGPSAVMRQLCADLPDQLERISLDSSGARPFEVVMQLYPTPSFDPPSRAFRATMRLRLSLTRV